MVPQWIFLPQLQRHSAFGRFRTRVYNIKKKKADLAAISGGWVPEPNK
jgi:hypothetical protein